MSPESSQAEWRTVRRQLNHTRGALARTAVELYRTDLRLGDVPFMARREWIPSAPIRLEDIDLEWSDDAAGALVGGGEPEAACVLPLRASGQRFARYTSAIRDLDLRSSRTGQVIGCSMSISPPQPVE